MKKRPYKYSNQIPKAFKQKKMDRAKTVYGKKEHPLFTKTKLVKENKQTIWKHPGMFFIAGLVAVILIVPTIVVIPFIKDDSGSKMATAESESLTASTEGDPSVTVAVLRTASEQIENIPLETYVSRVVASEMPVDFEIEALKAQALAARTYIVNHMLSKDKQSGADVTDTVQHQVYKNESDLRKLWGNDYDEKMNKLIEAVSATKGKILTHNKAPITPAFFSTSNGYTENSEDYWDNELPYLRSVKSPWDKSSPKYLDQQIFTTAEVEAALGMKLANNGVEIKATRKPSGRVEKLNLAGKAFSGREVREKLKLQSSDFELEQKNGHFIFKTKGYGHGIGMSQYGANGMAKEGKTYEEIVKYYYQDIEVSTVGDTAPTLVAK